MGVLTIGKSGRAVRKIQEFLNQLGYSLANDGEFGVSLEAAVKDFQATHGMEVTGQVDRTTKVTIKRAARNAEKGYKRPTERTTVALVEAITPHLDEPDIDEDLLKPITSLERNNLYGGKKFNTLAEAHTYYNTLLALGIPEDKKQSVLADFRRFAILSVFGSSPTVSEIDKLKSTIDKEAWLQPEANDVYMNYYVKDSPNWFSEMIRVNGTPYFYTVKKRDGSTQYSLEIKVVRNLASSLAYSGSIAAVKSESAINVEIYKAELQGYRWAEDKSSAMIATLEKGKNTISVKSTGIMSGYHVGNHTNTKAQDAEFSEQNCIQAALQCFILEYTKILR